MYPKSLSRNLRITIIVLGVTLMLLSLAALYYAFAPIHTLVEQTELAPTLFKP
ncbi:MAG: hypothetical protein MUC85_03880 [Anaerolineales bacterium]|jgi:hypothetical protein|nr:hypothetical protein [Anaerolineales bacterium]